MYLLFCKACGKVFKAQKTDTGFITDFGDEITSCFCEGELEAIKTEDWIADLVFKIKGK